MSRRSVTCWPMVRGIGNGLSMGGVVARAEVMDSLGANSISTFGGSPITTAGALANLGYLIDHDLQGNARRVGGLLKSRLEAVAARLDIVREVRGRGLWQALALADSEAGAVEAAARRRGLLVNAVKPDVVRLAPPLAGWSAARAATA